MRNTKITIYRAADGDWWWTRKAGNGKIIGASTEGYKRKRDAVANLIAELGGILYLTGNLRTPDGGLYQQGELVRADVGISRFVINDVAEYRVNSAPGECEVIPVQVLP